MEMVAFVVRRLGWALEVGRIVLLYFAEVARSDLHMLIKDEDGSGEGALMAYDCN